MFRILRNSEPSPAMSNATRHEILVGLNVTDDESYSNYRAAMTPLLPEFHGAFRFDFTKAGVHVDGPCLQALRATAATNALEHEADIAMVALLSH